MMFSSSAKYIKAKVNYNIKTQIVHEHTIYQMCVTI